MEIKASDLEVEPTDESSGHCDCCGNQTRTVWGYVRKKGAEALAAYFMHWTVGKPLDSLPANFDLIYGAWGEGSSEKDRCAISLVHFEDENGPGVTVVDARDRAVAKNELVGSSKARDDVVGTPLAGAAFAIFDAVLAQDQRLH